ncbi:FAS-like protein [Mya arenaria]|uniref:Fatty acid synthase n=1 Tax=Mya arenaria TaxID=6604 RepID=A0ABY7FS65_MYAAR|nr:FAS-like protein [Mya arenaria]
MQHRGDYSDKGNFRKEYFKNRETYSNKGNSSGIQPIAPHPFMCTDGAVNSVVSCRLPQSDNMLEFRDNLINGVDMVTEDSSRWLPGVNPDTVKGSRTGVFIGAVTSKSHEAWLNNPESTVGYGMTGCSRSMLAKRLSFVFGFKGPSYAVDTACSSSLLALDHALHSIRSGLCDAAVVGGSHLCLKPAIAVQFMKLGMLSPDGMCKSFDAKARRIYCTLLHTKNNCDGYKDEGRDRVLQKRDNVVGCSQKVSSTLPYSYLCHQSYMYTHIQTSGITFPSGEVQKQLLEEAYSEVGVNPAQVAYVEAHGTGTKAGDLPEVNTICDVFCKGRIGALPIQSVKSNMGHAEPASGLAAVAKVIVAMEEGLIPGNLNYHEPNPDISGLTGIRPGMAELLGLTHLDLVELLFMRSSGPVIHMFIPNGAVKGRDLHKLMHETAHMPASSHPYSGFTVLNGNGVANVQRVTAESRPVWFVFSGMGSQWHGMGRNMMDYDIFKESILRSNRTLQPYGVKLYNLLMNGDETTFESTVNFFAGIAAIQLATMGLTAAETVLAAYSRGRCIQEAKLPSDAMAAVGRGREEDFLTLQIDVFIGLTWSEAHQQCPEGVVPACHNSRDSVTVSVPQEAVRAFVQQLKERASFAKEVNTAGVAFHSYYMKSVACSLKTLLDEVIPIPRLRTSRWISSSIPKHLWSSELAMKCSAEYLVNNLVSPVLFKETLQCVPDNAIVIEIAPHCLLQPILKRSLSDECCIVGLMQRGHEESMMFCLSNLGKTIQFQHGLRPNTLGLTTDVPYPVPSGTPMLSPLVSWDHWHSWSVPTADMFAGGGASASCGSDFDIDLSPGSEDHYLIDHNIDGRVLYPATGYLVVIWKLLAKRECKMFDEMSVEFKDVKFHRATFLQQNGKIHFEVSLMQGTGAFEILEGGSTVCTGNVILGQHSTPFFNTPEVKSGLGLSKVDFNKEFRLRGHEYGPAFQGIVAGDLKGSQYADMIVNPCYILSYVNVLKMTEPKVSWNGLKTGLPSWMPFYKCACFTKHNEALQGRPSDRQDVAVEYDEYTDTCIAGGVKLLKLHTTPIARQIDTRHPVLEVYKFTPCTDSTFIPCADPLGRTVQRNLSSTNKKLQTMISGENVLDLSRINGSAEQTFADADYIGNDKYELLSLLKEMYDDTTGISQVQKNIKMLKKDVLFRQLLEPETLQPCLDLLIENIATPRLRIVEVGGVRMMQCLEPHLSKLPDVKHSYVFSCVDCSTEHVNGVENIHWSLDECLPTSIQKPHMIVLDNILHKERHIEHSLENILESIENDGFVLIHEQTKNFELFLAVNVSDVRCYDSQANKNFGLYCTVDQWKQIFLATGCEIIFERSERFTSLLFLLRKKHQLDIDKQLFLDVSDTSCFWVEELKSRIAILQPKGENLWLMADDDLSGILGLVNCLQKEPGGKKIRCVFTDGSLNGCDKRETLKQLLPKDLVMNVYRKGIWWTYRHSPSERVSLKDCTHAYANVKTIGDLSSLHWIESPLHTRRNN